jgi:5-methylcytosine-specific restriction enzyme A
MRPSANKWRLRAASADDPREVLFKTPFQNQRRAVSDIADDVGEMVYRFQIPSWSAVVRLNAPCLDAPCGAFAVRRGRCREHLKLYEKAQRERYGPRGRPWRRLRARVLARDKTCRNCGKPATHADHVVPRALGGSNAMINLQGLCANCNLRKGARA